MRIVLNPLTATLYAKDRSSLKDNNNILPMPSRISTVLMLIQTIRKNEESLERTFFLSCPRRSKSFRLFWLRGESCFYNLTRKI